MKPFEDVFPIENEVIFHCYVSLPEGKRSPEMDWEINSYVKYDLLWLFQCACATLL